MRLICVLLMLVLAGSTARAEAQTEVRWKASIPGPERSVSSIAARTTLRRYNVTVAIAKAAHAPALLPQSPPSRTRGVSGKSVLLGAIVGGGAGAGLGAAYCSADCGGGRTRGALVFGAFGAGIGAGVVALVSALNR